MAAVAYGQRTLFSQFVGSDTLKIKGDACLWTRGWLQASDSLGKKTIEKTFGRAHGFVGVTVQYGRYAYARYYYDLGEINGKPAYDLYAGVNWQGLDFRFGQLKLPLGYEVICAPWRTDLIENSIIAGLRTPTAATRDLGGLLLYTHRYVQPSIGIVNGSGRNVSRDNDGFLDLAGRLAVTPLGNAGLTLAVTGYLGNDTFARQGHRRPFARLGAEVLWNQRHYFIRSEFLMGHDSTDSSATGYRKFSGGYLAAGYRVGSVQPVLRIERLFRQGKTLSALTFGVNAFFVADMFKPMLNITLTNDEDRQTTATRVMAQLQAAFW